jgi:hypothetical protein
MSAPRTSVDPRSRRHRRHRRPPIGIAPGQVLASVRGCFFLAGGGDEVVPDGADVPAAPGE